MSARWFQRLPGTLRTLHRLTSLSSAIAITFFAATGLVANLRSQDEPQDAPPEAAPARLLDQPAALSSWLEHRLRLGQPPRLEDRGFAWIATAADGPARIEAEVAKPSGILQVTRWQPLPAAAPVDRAGLASWFTAREGGDADAGDDVDDAGAPLTFSLTSVWTIRTITVDRHNHRWNERSQARGLGVALADLHSGKHANRMQRALMDLTACSLLASTISGMVIGLCWVTAQRRRLALATLIAGGIWTALMIIAR